MAIWLSRPTFTELHELSIISAGFISIQLFLFCVHPGQFFEPAEQYEVQVTLQKRGECLPKPG